MDAIHIVHTPPKAEEYLALRKRAGLSAMSREGAEAGLPNSLFAVCLRRGEELVGMGRVIGDGGCFFQVVDIAVHPDSQGQGYGKRIMSEIMDYFGVMFRLAALSVCWPMFRPIGCMPSLASCIPVRDPKVCGGDKKSSRGNEVL